MYTGFKFYKMGYFFTQSQLPGQQRLNDSSSLQQLELFKQAAVLYIELILEVVELGDTAFIVLRKTPLPFLHW